MAPDNKIQHAGNIVQFRPLPTVAVEAGGRWPGWAITVRSGRRVQRNHFIAWKATADECADQLAASRGWRRA